MPGIPVYPLLWALQSVRPTEHNKEEVVFFSEMVNMFSNEKKIGLGTETVRRRKFSNTKVISASSNYCSCGDFVRSSKRTLFNKSRPI
jgi:hypothetical protein